ncbi:MAG: lytic transglycosylase domain-containing protein [Bacteroidia bacterium]|nr:lytic transglycosylase domain-containing protein [Bacteroidia bacterium]
MNKTFLALAAFIFFLALADLFIYASKKTDDQSFQQEINTGYKVYSLNIPKNLNFAGEIVPINNFDVRESFDRELVQNVYFQSQTIITIKRANRWLPVIERILKQENIPADFKYLAIIESNLTNVISPAGATGFWQFLEGTGKQYGLEINEQVDERYDVERSTLAACKYFKEAYACLGNWSMVAGSYNMGITGIKKQAEMQKTNNYYELLLNQETGRYVFRLLAMKEIFTNPQRYGYKVRKKDLYIQIPTVSHTINAPVQNLAEWAIDKGVSYKLLKLFNPWLRKNELVVINGKKYIVKIPKNGYTNYEKLLPLFMENKLDSANYFMDTLLVQ